MRRAALIALGVAVALAGTFETGRRQAGYDFIAAHEARQRLEARITALSAEQDARQQRIAQLERAAAMDRQALAETSRDTAKLQEDISGLRDKLALYREVTDDARAHGVQMQALRWVPGGDPGQYRYQLTLARFDRAADTSQGTASLRLQGALQGKPHSIALREIGYRFRYFQTLEGEARLPAGFAPEFAEVGLQPLNGGEPARHERIPWQVEDGG